MTQRTAFLGEFAVLRTGVPLFRFLLGSFGTKTGAAALFFLRMGSIDG